MEFDQVGGNAIFVNNYNRNTLVKGCHIHATGASGVCFVGDPNAVRDPLFEYHETNDLSKIDRTPGPKTSNYPADGIVDDCLIHDIGRVERQPAGVQISMAQGITVRDASIYDCARAGINISEGTWGGHLIERCDVFATVQETHDHGSFNSWGRDRFWHKDRNYSQKMIDEDPELPFLDAMETTVIRNSRWRCDHGWDIDLDDGSTNYDIYNNLMLSGGLKLREGFRRRAWNNITVNNTLHPHVWYTNSNDEVFSNIFMYQYRAIRLAANEDPGNRVDSNLIFNSQLTHKYGWDEHSIVADPLFVNPQNGDFSVKEGSPAFEIGFKNFPMDQFGVKKASLKAIARTPKIPVLGDLSRIKSKIKKKKTTPQTAQWMGASVRGLSGEEFSAYGVAKEDGGIALIKLPQSAPLASSGLKEGDLILSVNDKKVSTSSQFLNLIKQSDSDELKLKIVRDQAEKMLIINQGLEK